MNKSRILLAGVLLLVGFSANAEDGVARSSFTTAIQDREPVDQVGQLTNDTSTVYFFTEIRGMKDRTITHRWEKGGDVKAEVTFNVGGNRWRVWSSKNMQPGWLGEWQVSVVDDGGNILSQNSFAYIPAIGDAAEATAAAAPVPAATEPAPTAEPAVVEEQVPAAAPVMDTTAQ